MVKAQMYYELHRNVFYDITVVEIFPIMQLSFNRICQCVNEKG